MFDFKIDFSKSVPYRFCPDTQAAAALYIQCVANAPMDIEFRKVRPGIFNITVQNERDKKRLENKIITFDFKENSHELHSTRIPIELMEKRAFYNNPKWVTIDKMYDSALRYAENEKVDSFLSEFGSIIVPTHYEKDKYGFRTGRRKVRIDLVKEIERWREVELESVIEGKEVSAKGRVNFFYKGQPYHCWRCQETHTDKCAQLVAQLAR